MALIKNAQAERTIRDAIVLDLGDLSREAGSLIEQARGQADQMIAKARDETDRLTSTATKHGYGEGFEEGRAAGLKRGTEDGHQQALTESTERVEQLVAGFTSALTDWEERRGRMFIEAREDVLAFAIALARRVVYRTIELEPEVVAEQVAAALQLIRAPSRLKISVNPDDRLLVEATMPDLMKLVSSAEDITLVDDPTINRGGCVVATTDGEVDAQIPTQLDRIAASLLPVRPPSDDLIELMGTES